LDSQTSTEKDLQKGEIITVKGGGSRSLNPDPIRLKKGTGRGDRVCSERVTLVGSNSRRKKGELSLIEYNGADRPERKRRNIFKGIHGAKDMNCKSIKEGYLLNGQDWALL